MTATIFTLDCLSFHSMTSVIQCDFFINISQIKTQHLPLSSLYVNQHLQLYCGVMSLTGNHIICFLFSTGIYNNQHRQSYRQAYLILVLVLRVNSGTHSNIYYRKLRTIFWLSVEMK
jgi:hypothetical protein